MLIWSCLTVSIDLLSTSIPVALQSNRLLQRKLIKSSQVARPSKFQWTINGNKRLARRSLKSDGKMMKIYEARLCVHLNAWPTNYRLISYVHLTTRNHRNAIYRDDSEEWSTEKRCEENSEAGASYTTNAHHTRTKWSFQNWTNNDINNKL